MTKYDKEVKAFEKWYSADWEDEAHAQRGEFIEKFPMDSLARLQLSRYAIGHGEQNSFCYWVEPGTRKWAIINGATAVKFGIYYGKTKTDPVVRYRYSKIFSADLAPAGEQLAVYKRIRGALVQLLHDGEKLAFAEIDDNPLSQMFKAKILSLYFPEKYIAICSAERLYDIGQTLSIVGDSPSQIQHDALSFKQNSNLFREWTVLKFASFLYDGLLLYEAPNALSRKEKKVALKNHRVVDFEKLMAMWRALGEMSERYALSFEQRRLRSLGLPDLAELIEDCTNRPGFGYDFKSFSSRRVARCIEVKTLTNINTDEARFFLSENERRTSEEMDHGSQYFFYLVIYGADRMPNDVRVVSASKLYLDARLDPQNYMVTIAR